MNFKVSFVEYENVVVIDMKMKLKSRRIRSIEEMWDLDEKYFPSVVGRSFLSAGGVPKRKKKK